MTGFFPLLRLQMLSRFADLKPKNLKTALKEKRGRTIGMFIAILILIAYMGGFLFILEQKALDLLTKLNVADTLVTMAVVLATAGTLILAFFFILSTMFLSRDAVFIAAMPVKTRTVLAAKLVQVWISETLIDAIILLPACIQYGIRVGAGADFYLRMVIVWLCAAMIPIAIISFVSSLIIRISALWKHREIIATVGGIAFFVVYMVAMMNLGGMTGDSIEGGEMMEKMIMDYSTRISAMTGIFPPAGWAAKGMLGDWGMLGLYVLVSVGSMALTVWLLGYYYRKLSMLQTETPMAKGKKGIQKGSIREAGALKANVKREFLQILRVPSYMMNILPIAIMPLIMTVILVGMVGRNMGEEKQGLQALFQTLGNTAIIMAILAAIMAYMGGMNPALSTAVTREGKGHDFLLGLPVQPRTLIRSKFIVGYALSTVGMVGASAVMAVMFPFAILEVVMALVLCLLFSYACDCMALSHDIKHPKLNWMTEQEAVKQNFGVMISMLVSWGILIALAGLTYLMISNGWTLWPVFGVLAAILAVLCVVTRQMMYRTADKYYCKQ